MDMDLKKVDQGKIRAFLSFDLMVLPSLIKVLFILGAIGIVLSGLSWPFMVATMSHLGPYGGRSEFSCGVFAVACVASAIGMSIGLVWWRIICESMIILFKIHEALVPKKPLDSKPAEAAAPAPSPEKAPAPPPPPPAPSA